MKTKLITTIMITLFLASMLSMAFVAPVAATPDSSIVGLWHFNEGIGSTAYDSSGFDNDGTLSGGKFGNALEFDGTDDYVRVPGSTSLDITDKITVEAWIKPKSPYSIHGDIVRRQKGYQLCLLTSGKIEVTLWFSGNPAFWLDSISTIPIPATRFYHVAFTYDKDVATGNLKIYIDGALDAEYTVAQEPITPWGVLGIGAVTDGGQYWWFTGIIDEVRISNIARTTFDLTSAPTVDANTVALWHFDESVGTIVYDEADTPDADDGTTYGAKWAGPTWTTEGMFDGALEFDGVDDYVEVPSTSVIMPLTLTVEAWVKPSKTGARQSMVSKWDGWVDASYSLELTSANKFLFYLHNGMATQSITGTTVITPGTWYHVAATYDGTYARLYVNGVLEAGPTVLVSPMTTSSVPLRIGASAKPSPYPLYVPYGGIIDEVRIWNVALTDEQIQACWNYELPLSVGIDIKPGSYPNSINLGDQGLLPVAILGSETFDVTTIDPATIMLGTVIMTTRGSAKAPKLAYSFEDVNGDGFMDLIAFFSIPELVGAGVLTDMTTALTLTAKYYVIIPIVGTDSVRVVPS